MLKKLEKITECHDPEVTRLEELDERVATYIKRATIALLIIGFVVAIIVSSLVADHYESDSEIEINAFGFTIFVDEENVFVSPFMIFLYVFLIFDLVVILISRILTLVFTNMGIKRKMLDNTYQTMLFTKEIAKSSFQTMKITQETAYPTQSDEETTN